MPKNAQPRDAVWFNIWKSINFVHENNRIKLKKTWLFQKMERKVAIKFNAASFMTLGFRKLGIEENILSLIKCIFTSSSQLALY